MRPRAPILRVNYVTRSGTRRIYEYARRPQLSAADHCLAALRRAPLRRTGKACWSGEDGPAFYHVTVSKLVARGLAEIVGDRLVAIASPTPSAAFASAASPVPAAGRAS